MSQSDPNQMTFFEHLEELRNRILKSLVIWVVVFALCFVFVKEHIFPFLAEPLIALSKTSYVFAATDVKEPFFANIKAAFWVSIILSSGILFYHVWRFVAPGLTRKERFFAVPFLIFMSLFFIAGCIFSFQVVFPTALEYLLSWNEDSLNAFTRSSYLSILFAFVMGMGASFEMPLVIFFLAKIGVVTPRFLLKQFRYAVLIIFVIAALITPTPDFYTQTILAVPMIVLYLLGIAAATLVSRKKVEEQPEKLKHEDRGASENGSDEPEG